MSDIKKLTDEILEFSRERDWLQFHNPKDLAESIVIEAAELLEHFQWKSQQASSAHAKEKLEDVSDEIADVLVYTLELAHNLGVDVEAAITHKMKKNAKKYPVEK